MVLNLFTGADTGVPQRVRGGRRSAQGADGQDGTRRRPRSRSAAGTAGAAGYAAQGADGQYAYPATSESDRKLFTDCAAQVQRNLKAHAGSPSTLHTLASYYTRVEPYIEGRPFCVSLSYATFLFHMQMARISVSDVLLYVELVEAALSQIRRDDQQTHPFVQQVLRDHVFGLPSPTCRGAPHCVVLLPPPQYRAFATMAGELVLRDAVPLDVSFQLQDRLEFYCRAASPLVANRALALLVRTVPEVCLDEQVQALQHVLRSKPAKINLDFLLACYERLQRAVLDAANGPTFGRALSIHCSELFLRFRSPIRREYVERFLYPSLCHPDMLAFLQIPATRQHLTTELLAQCTAGMSSANPFYLCLCALMQHAFNDEIDGAIEIVTVLNCRMPHGAYFMSTLAVDTHMSVSMFAKIIIALARGAGMAMTGREGSDDVADSIGASQTSVYSVLFVLREVVRSCSVTSSRRATDMLKALSVAIPMATVDALGKLSMEAFGTEHEVAVDPQLLCAEIAMVLHHEHIVEAMDSAVDYFRDATTLCQFCGAPRTSSLLCPVNDTVHVVGQASVSRVLSTLAECAAAKVLQDRLIELLRDPRAQMESAVHFLTYHIIANAGQHRNGLFVLLEPYIRSTLMTLVTADRSGTRGLIGSEQKANVLMLHVRLCILLSSSIDPSYLESIIKVFSELKIRNNHDALALWYMANLLIRNCKGNVDLLPTDPRENSYCVAYPAVAPTTATCADNAQLLLKLMDKAHGFSPVTRKLVGCCVCKLIQDFNIQASNIISSLLSPYGFVPIGLGSLNEFALPVGMGTTFWSFFLRQVRSSAPARTAFMTALARCMSSRFRVATPADAVSAAGGRETTGHVFAVMVYEAVKRSPALARVLLYMVSNWMRQSGHTPGKFVCLVYVCTQLLEVVVHRGDGPASIEMIAETRQEAGQFEDCVSKAAKLLRKQEGRLEKLLPAARRDNVEFYHLAHRLQRRVRRTVAASLHEELPDDGADAEEELLYYAQQPGEAASIRDLQNAEDNSLFDVDVDVDGAMDGGDYDYNSYNGDERMESDPLAQPLPPSGALTGEVGASNTTSSNSHTNTSGSSSGGGAAPLRSAAPSGTGEATPSALRPAQSVNTAKTHAAVGEAADAIIKSARRGAQQQSVGTSPIQQLQHQQQLQQLQQRPSTASAQDRVSTWLEPDLASGAEGGDVTPIEETGVPQLQAVAGEGAVLPSALVLEYLRTHQSMDSLTHEMHQMQDNWTDKYLQSSRPGASDGTRLVQAVSVEGRANNYSRPHDRNGPAPSRTVVAPVHVRQVGQPQPQPQQQQQQQQQQQRKDVVDGERPITPVSEPVEESKRRRTEAGVGSKGMNFFLQQQRQHSRPAEVMAELREMQARHQQRDDGDVISDRENAVPRATPHPAEIASEGLPPTTPYGQIILPTCFVEQRNDTAIRELRQVMGAYSPNDGRLSASGKRKIRGNGEESRSAGSTAWWAEMSSAPMPSYAADPQYSMELF